MSSTAEDPASSSTPHGATPKRGAVADVPEEDDEDEMSDHEEKRGGDTGAATTGKSGKEGKNGKKRFGSIIGSPARAALTRREHAFVA